MRVTAALFNPMLDKDKTQRDPNNEFLWLVRDDAVDKVIQY